MEKKSWIKTYIIDVLPSMSILLYILAIVYEMTFFSVFDIGVLSYISLTETLVSIIEPLLYFTLLLLMSIAEFYIIAKSSFSGIIPILDTPELFNKSKKSKHNSKLSKLPRIVKIFIVTISIPLIIPLSFAYALLNSIIIISEKLLEEALTQEKYKKNRLLVWGFICAFIFTLSYLFWTFSSSGFNGTGNALSGLFAPIVIILCYYSDRKSVV